MPVEAPRRQESNPSPEAQEVVRGYHFAALHPRLLIGGEALNPEKSDLAPLTTESLGNIRERDYKVFAEASNTERRAYWGEGDFKEQKREWVEKVTATFQKGNKFFTESKKGQQWSKVLTRVGIQAAEFSPQQAEEFYQRYLQAQGQDERMKLFVQQIISFPNYQPQDLEAVYWLAHTFGKKSAEVIFHLISAEKQLQDNPEILVRNANQPASAGEGAVNRINVLTTDEKRILKFLWNKEQGEEAGDNTGRGSKPDRSKQPSGDSSVPIPPVKRKRGFGWRYEKPTEPRHFPHEQMVGQLLNPTYIADELKRRNPNRYGVISTLGLAREIVAEHARLQRGLGEVGLDKERLDNVAMGALRHYENFIEREYGVNIPDIANIRIQPINGMAAEYFGIQDGVLAFVNPGFPIIFLNMDYIPKLAVKLGLQKGIPTSWMQMDPTILGSLIAGILNEVHPHEYNHLIGDLAYWKFVKDTGAGEKVERIFPGKMGFMVGKPVKYEQGNVVRYGFKERGRELMEAVTTEITSRWAQSMGQELDLQSYAAEREVLLHLENLLAKEQNISRKESFKKFVQAYFSPKSHFPNLVKELSGSKDASGKYPRPHFLSIIYGLMGYENAKFQAQGRPGRYELTLAFINNLLNSAQKAEIVRGIKYLQLSPLVEKHLLNSLATTQSKAA